MENDHNHDEACDACPSVLPKIAIAAGGAALIAWLFGRHSYRQDVVRALIRSRDLGVSVPLPDEGW